MNETARSLSAPWVILLGAVFSAANPGCGASVAAGARSTSSVSEAPIEISHERCDVDANDAQKTDANSDSRPDLIQVMSGGREVCRAVDLNFDGVIDSYLYFDAEGKLRRRESDFDRDGVTDEVAIYDRGSISRKFRETNLDGKLDTWDSYQNGKLVKRMRDADANGSVDQWWEFPDPKNLECPLVATDTDGDGRPDAKHDVCAEHERAVAPSSSSPAPTPTPAEPGSPGSPDKGGSS